MLKNISLLIYIALIKIKTFFSFKRGHPRILIIKIDAIGDYIIFRNFIKEIAESAIYKGFKITLVCNKTIRDIAIELDSEKIDEFIFIDGKANFKTWLFYLKEIVKFKYHTVINFHYSRDLRNEFIAFAASAGKKITMDGDYIFIKPYLKKIINSIYSSLVSIPINVVHEFEINQFFTETIISAKLNYTHPYVSLPGCRKYPQVVYNPSTIIIAPGSGAGYRQFTSLVLFEIVQFLTENYFICFIGSSSDTAIVDNLKNKLPQNKIDRLMDLTGKTSLKAIPYIIADSLCVICNDSGMYHLSVALNKPVLCIAGGGHFKRFVSYKERENIKISNFYMPCYNCNWGCIYKVPANNPYPCLSSINAGDVFEKFRMIEEFSIPKK